VTPTPERPNTAALLPTYTDCYEIAARIEELTDWTLWAAKDASADLANPQPTLR
jgi:hypothetical protein